MCQGLDAPRDKALAPNSNLTPIETNLEADVLVLPTLCCKQDNAGALLDAPPLVLAHQERLQLPFDPRLQLDLLCNSHWEPIARAAVLLTCPWLFGQSRTDRLTTQARCLSAKRLPLACA